jgi:hypothetical protein
VAFYPFIEFFQPFFRCGGFVKRTLFLLPVRWQQGRKNGSESFPLNFCFCLQGLENCRCGLVNFDGCHLNTHKLPPSAEYIRRMKTLNHPTHPVENLLHPEVAYQLIFAGKNSETKSS